MEYEKPKMEIMKLGGNVRTDLIPASTPNYEGDGENIEF